jgi:hypothetical protein
MPTPCVTMVDVLTSGMKTGLMSMLHVSVGIDEEAGGQSLRDDPGVGRAGRSDACFVQPSLRRVAGNRVADRCRVRRTDRQRVTADLVRAGP